MKTTQSYQVSVMMKQQSPDKRSQTYIELRSLRQFSNLIDLFISMENAHGAPKYEKVLFIAFASTAKN